MVARKSGEKKAAKNFLSAHFLRWPPAAATEIVVRSLLARYSCLVMGGRKLWVCYELFAEFFFAAFS